MKIGIHTIGNSTSPYIIAEIGVNHEGSRELACRLIEEAAAGGAHAAKFQTYKASTIASRNSPAYWDLSKEPTGSQYELFLKYDVFGADDYYFFADHCRKVGIEFLSTPFDLPSVDFLDPLMPVFKIASADITNIPLLRKVAGKKKPVLLSTGASTLPEIGHAVMELRTSGVEDIVLLHCVLNYPTPPEHAQLGMIPVLKRVFPDCLIGYSDHVVPDETISSLEVAMLLGACVLEKHFTHDKTLPGNDHYHAMDCHDLARFSAKSSLYRCLIGGEEKNLTYEAPAILHARRSIVALRPIAAGEQLTEENLIAKRPGHGISPLYWDRVVGRTATRDLDEDELLNWQDISA